MRDYRKYAHSTATKSGARDYRSALANLEAEDAARQQQAPSMPPVSTASVMQMPSSFQQAPSVAQVNAKTGSISMPVKVNNPFQQPKALPGMVDIKPQTFPTNHVGPLDAAVNFYKQFAKGAQDAVAYDAGQPVPSTGSKAADKTARFIGNTVAGLTTGQTEMQALGAVGRGVESVAAKVAPRLVSRLAGNAAEGAAQGAVGGAMMGQTNAKDIATNAAAGATFGLGAHVIGKAAQAIADRTGLSDKLASFVTRHRSVPPALETATREMMQTPTQPARKLGIATGPLKNASNESYINKVMSDIKPIVTERMTPPLENPNELAKWLQPHLDTSLNQIRKLHYNDMVELANEVQSHMSMYDVAKTVAKEKGYNLDRILNNQVPSIKQTADRLRMGRVAGAVEPPNTNVRVAVSPDYAPTVEPAAPSPAPAEPGMFGPQNLGISAFAKKPGPYENLRTDTKSQLVSKLTPQRPTFKGAAHRFYTSVVDDLHSLNQFDKLTQKVLGKDLKPTERTHQLALATRGADVVSNQILTHALVDSTGKVVAPSLKDALSSIPKGKFVDFEDYLVNKHAITRAQRGEKVFRDELNWTPEKGAEKVAMYEAKHPEFVKAAEAVKTFQNTMLQKWLVDTGIITPEQAQAYVDANPNYVPMKRQFTDLEKTGKNRAKKGYANQSNPSKKYSPTGSQRKIISPIESMIENVDSFVKAAKRNQVMQAFVKNIDQNPEAFKDFAEIVNKPAKKLDMTNPDNLDEMLTGMTEDFNHAMQKTRLDKDNIVRVLINGEPVHVKINDKQLLEAVTALGPENGSKLLDAIGWLTNKMKVLTTGANPMFSLTRNILRDIPQAYIASKSTGNPIRFAADLADAAWSIARNKPLYQEFKNMGGGHASSVAADRNLLRQSKREILPRKNPVQGIVPRAFNKMENFLNAVESAPRLAEYKRFAAGGTVDDRLRGIFEANDVTTNFKRRGKFTRELDKVFPYFNAAVAGLDKFARIYAKNPVQASVKSFLAVTIPTLAAYAYNYDNPDYQKVSNRIKDNYILIPKGDGTFYKIAKPKEIGTAWSDIPERLMRMFYQQDPKAFADFAEQLRNTFTIPGIQGALKSGSITQRLSGVLGDTIVGPVADVQANQNFAGSPIVPGYLANLSPALQSDAKTSSLSKRVGELTGTSPKELDYLIGQYTGVLGQVGLPMMAPGSGTAGKALANSINQQVTADPVFSNDIMTQFYNSKSKYDQANNDSSVTGKLPAWYSDATRKYLGRVSKNIGDIRKKMRAIESDQSIKSDVKRQQLRMMQDQMNKLAEVANQKVAGVVK